MDAGRRFHDANGRDAALDRGLVSWLCCRSPRSSCDLERERVSQATDFREGSTSTGYSSTGSSSTKECGRLLSRRPPKEGKAKPSLGRSEKIGCRGAM